MKLMESAHCVDENGNIDEPAAKKATREYVNALATYYSLRKKTKNGSGIMNFNINRLSLMAKIHPGTLKKSLNTLVELGYVDICDTKSGKQHLFFRRIKSSNKFKNMELVIMDNSFETIKDFIYLNYIAEIVRRKNFAEKTIAEANDPSDLATYKRAKKLCQKYKYGKHYIEYGLSYNGIAKKLHCSLGKVAKLIGIATINKFLIKRKQFIVQRNIVAPELKFKYDPEDYLYATPELLIKTKANVYELGHMLKQEN